MDKPASLTQPQPAAIIAPFTELVSQPYAARFLSQAISSAQANHAYLFVGPLGAGKTEAARLLAEALLCSDAQSNADYLDDCLRVRHGTHPDLHLVEPLGTSGYLAEQITELIHDSALAPVRAKRKIYLITRADLLRGTTANALLKTLEEPPESVTFVLLARTREAVLPTIFSRCQVIAFRRVPESEAVSTVCARSGEPAANARIALAVTGGSVYRAVEYVRSAERRSARLEVLGVLERLDTTSDMALLESVKQLLQVFKAPLQAVQEKLSEQLEQSRDYLGKGALTRLEQQHKRELSSRERETIGEALDVIRSWLRDVLMLKVGYAVSGKESKPLETSLSSGGAHPVPKSSQGTGGTEATGTETIVNYDHHYHIARTAVKVRESQILAALNSVDAAQEQIQYNVAVQLALESLLFKIRLAMFQV